MEPLISVKTKSLQFDCLSYELKVGFILTVFIDSFLSMFTVLIEILLSINLFKLVFIVHHQWHDVNWTVQNVLAFVVVVQVMSYFYYLPHFYIAIVDLSPPIFRHNVISVAVMNGLIVSEGQVSSIAGQ
jgi:hypothetical protein